MKCRKLTFAYSLFLVHLQSCVVRCGVLHMIYVLHGRALGSGTKLHHPLTNNIVLISTYYKGLCVDGPFPTFTVSFGSGESWGYSTPLEPFVSPLIEKMPTEYCVSSRHVSCVLIGTNCNNQHALPRVRPATSIRSPLQS